VLIAVTMTLAGLAVEAGSGHQEPGSPFAIGYTLGCVVAALAVRQSGIFTAVIQPPLLLFVAVPLAYYLFHSSSFRGLKEVAISCGYPLIERFPLMLFTTSAVLLIGLIRWYLAMAHPGSSRAAGAPPRAAATRGGGLLGGLSTKLSSAFAGNGSVDEQPGQRSARPRHVVSRPAPGKPGKPGQRTQQRSTARSRNSPPVDEFAPPRPRRDPGRRPVDGYASEPPRRRPPDPREQRRTPPPRRDPRERREYRDAYPPPGARGGGYEPYETGRGYPSQPAYPAYPQRTPGPRRRPAPTGSSGTHHPVSRVRYRDSGPGDADFPSR
jgi:hypothetical protein